MKLFDRVRAPLARATYIAMSPLPNRRSIAGLKIRTLVAAGEQERALDLATAVASKTLTAKATLAVAKCSSVLQRVGAVLALTHAGARVHPTSAEILAAASQESLYHGDYDAALDFAKRALYMQPRSKEAIVAWLDVHVGMRRVPDTGQLLSILLANGGKTPVGWGICKVCASKEVLAAIHDHYATNGRIPVGHLRKVSHAAARAEDFDLARELMLQAVRSASDVLGVARAPARHLGSAGTQALLDVALMLDQAAIPYFAAAGTALGIVREGAPLLHDDDVDIGIFEKFWDLERLHTAIRKNPLFKLDTIHPKTAKIGIVHRSGATIDLFRYYQEADAFYHNGVFTRWKNAPFDLERRQVNGYSLHVPAGDNYLVENYGDWRKPDPLFDAFINGPNREIIWPEYYALHVLRAVNKALVNGKEARAIVFMKQGIADGVMNSSEVQAFNEIIDRTAV